jgi:hypothetical protein
LIQRLLELSQRTEAATKVSFGSLRAEIDDLQAATAKAESRAKQVETYQEATIQRLLEQLQRTETSQMPISEVLITTSSNKE